MTTGPERTVHVVVRGRVQGVGYRWFAVRRARELGLRGWVRNAADGSVELAASGAEAAIEAFLTALRHGPSAARVEDVRVESAPTTLTEGHTDFEVEL